MNEIGDAEALDDKGVHRYSGGMARKTAALLKKHGINPSAQRVAIAQYVLHAQRHPTADQVLDRVTQKFPLVSRATVYNTLNLFVEKGLLRRYTLDRGNVVYDPHVAEHHHFIDETTGAIYDIPWDAIRVSNLDSLDSFEVEHYQVVMRGRKKSRGKDSTQRRRAAK